MTTCPLPDIVFDGVIDVSHHNGAIDWPAVADAGIVLAFVKATQGGGFVDPLFAANRSAATRAGVLVVPYHFVDRDDPADQAAHFCDVAGLAAGGAAMLDWESTAPAEAVALLGEALADSGGRAPVAYYGFAQLTRPDAALSRWPLMLPEYPRGAAAGCYRTLVSRPPRLPPGRAGGWGGVERPYDFHQYTPAGRVAGIATPVDRSVWVGSCGDLKAWYATGELPRPNAPPGI
jgi:GH25 family lysozyme M1 (1,4-beta-N-acetylmuramidase)